MSPTTEISLPHLSEHEYANYKKLIENVANTKNPGVTHELMRLLDRILNECEFQVRVIEAIKNGHNQPEHDPKLFEIELKTRYTYKQLLVKLNRVIFRVYNLERYYDILNEPYDPHVPGYLGTEKDRHLYRDLDTLRRHIHRLCAYLVPDDKLCENLRREEIPDNLPHIDGPLNLEEVRRKKKLADEKFEKECEQRQKEWLALTPEQRRAKEEAIDRQIWDEFGLMENDDGSITRKGHEDGTVQKRRPRVMKLRRCRKERREA